MHQLREVLFDASPVPEFLLLLALSIALASLYRTRMLHREALTRAEATIALIAATSVALPVLIICWTLGLAPPTPGPVPFEPKAWQSEPWMRAQMAPGLVESGRLSGLTRTEVTRLIGEGDGSVSGPDSWKLYRPRDAFFAFPPELVVAYHNGGKVSRYWIEPGLF